MKSEAVISLRGGRWCQIYIFQIIFEISKIDKIIQRQKADGIFSLDHTVHTKPIGGYSAEGPTGTAIGTVIKI